ncbi:MAG: FtsX-like permease family protein, partial [bacterium]|nr:FtsX-like permease family protein [bacterium]
MLKNYLKIAFRNIVKNRLYNSLNIVGLALGLSCSLLMIFHVKDELSYESNFPKADRIFRLVNDFSPGGGSTWAATSIPLGIEIKKSIPEVEHSGRFRWAYPQILSYTPDGEVPKQFEETKGFFVDSTIVSMFDIEFVKGDPRTALDRVYSLVMTESMAEKYFGDDDPFGKTIIISDFPSPCQVTGVIKDMPFNTHLQFDYLLSFSTFNSFLGQRGRANRTWSALYNYILIGENFTKGDVDAKMEEFTVEFAQNRYGSREETLNNVLIRLQPIKDIHLHSRLEKEMSANSDITYVYIFSAVAVFLLMIAGVNFINITNATALKRLREIGVRKVLGAQRKQLIRQFLGESYLLTIIGAAIGLILLRLFLPYYMSITGREIGFVNILNPENVLMILGIVILLGTFAGIYPAFFVSNFQSVDAF